jgi:Fe2+ transport system protein FeoA
MNTETVPLGRLDLGASGIVVGYSSEIGVRRFVEMGFVLGTRVTALRKAPLGDPVEYAVMGSRVAIRRGDADLVIVREVD